MSGNIGKRTATKLSLDGGGWLVTIYEIREYDGRKWNTPIDSFQVADERIADRFLEYVR